MKKSVACLMPIGSFMGRRRIRVPQPGLSPIASRMPIQLSFLLAMRWVKASVLPSFTQLYPAFSSIAMKRMWYLNDLFVIESARQQGVARALLKRVASFAKETDALTVKLATAVSNHPAKSLYESEGYQKVIAFDHYTQRV
ncbi:GNAT family N-acetyltransferase [Aeromonas sp. 2HA2]|uniref:GNAT family N-acetyltransferase n=1 Tax=Aeromonas sp. 2HA2 TaxID=2699194 RepID=UPI0023DD6858|nr:GNAT family N-acetyltransferase [Aeromonas sp. 2HA2]